MQKTLIDSICDEIRVKSLSKGNSSRKDLSSSTFNLRNSIALPVSRSEDVKIERLPYETNRFGWPKQQEQVSVARSVTYLPSSENYRSDFGNTDEEIMEDDFDYSIEKTDTQMKPIVEEAINAHATDELNALLEVTFGLGCFFGCRYNAMIVLFTYLFLWENFDLF